MALILALFDPIDSSDTGFDSAKTILHFGLLLSATDSVDLITSMDKVEMFLPTYSRVATKISLANWPSMNLVPVVMVNWAILPSVEFVVVWNLIHFPMNGFSEEK